MDSSGTMTLAFEFEALKELADPNAVFDDARKWTEYVGVLSDEPTYVVTNFTRKRRLRQDFFSGPRGVEESLDGVAEQFETDRHVFIGTTEEDRATAEAHDWEYLSIEEAAEFAEWDLGETEDAEDPFEAETRDDWP
ncbi:hypothetical protein SAMN04488065_1750 [Haloplanus vescus]|uniref:DUF7124 domain-containing protein n=1 Tax=Haloplanus vescus TaxID=555874 RepID=A0A1H3Y9P0_9EURY|nr:hypothetical protein [Haloplanus vescus]SEA08397.1 hypothetical protein SAMN04488065_1750 [Haloplanus vescus]